VVLERDRCAGVDTGHTSADLTMVTDVRLGELVKRFGRNHAQAVWDAGLAAIATIDEVVQQHAIDAAFEWVDGYLHVPPDDADHNREDLKADATLANDLGFDAEYVETVPLIDRPGIRFTDQARIQPRACVRLGGSLRDDTRQPALHRPSPSVSSSVVRAWLRWERHDVRITARAAAPGTMARSDDSRPCVLRVRPDTQTLSATAVQRRVRNAIE
jgi:hypothetical protein